MVRVGHKLLIMIRNVIYSIVVFSLISFSNCKGQVNVEDSIMLHDAVHLEDFRYDEILKIKDLNKKDSIINIWYEDSLYQVKSISNFRIKTELSLLKMNVYNDKLKIKELIGIDSLNNLIHFKRDN